MSARILENRIMKTSFNKLCIAALLALSASAHAGSGYAALPIQQATQEHSQWCWAASSVATLRLFNQTPSQCSVANWALGTSDACGDPNFNSNRRANQPNGIYGQSGSIQDILRHWGVTSNGIANYLSWTSSVNLVNGNRPFVIRFGWTNGGGHFVVGYGYDDRSGTKRLAYMNPWPGEGLTWSSYSWTVSASDHDWTHTLSTVR